MTALDDVNKIGCSLLPPLLSVEALVLSALRRLAPLSGVPRAVLEIVLVIDPRSSGPLVSSLHRRVIVILDLLIPVVLVVGSSVRALVAGTSVPTTALPVGLVLRPQRLATAIGLMAV